MLELRDEGSCLPPALVGVYVGLALLDAIIVLLSFYQLVRIHSRTRELGWTRQKVLHLMIGSSNTGYFIYFVLAFVAACNMWPCWSGSCGFILMAFPQILFLAAFLLLLSFWIDICHQPRDEDDEDEENGSQEALLGISLNAPRSSNIRTHTHRRCFPFWFSHVGSRQKFVMLVVVLASVLMLVFAVVIWIGMWNNQIDSSVAAEVYIDLIAVATLLLGGALAFYGLLLCLKMREVRSERASSEMSKVAGLAIVSVLCFTSSAFVALITDIPLVYQWHEQKMNVLYTLLLLIIYYLIGSSLPSAFVLWTMRELPPLIASNPQEESSAITFINDVSVSIHHPPQSWITTTSLQNQISRASPI